MTARPIKNSLTHPLPLPSVVTPGGGAIGMTMCPGKRQPDAATGPWDRDLAADLDAIVHFGARTLVTLMEADELVAAAVSADILRTAATERGLAWHHWPIVDFAAPGPPFEAKWSTEAHEICTVLSTGGRIVVHCRGGRGRSGLVAARFLVELGIENKAAIAAVRAVQPLAIETPSQERHLLQYLPTLVSPS